MEPGSTTTDYLMVLDYDLAPNEIAYVKISKSNEPYEYKADGKTSDRANGALLEITGFTETNEALFRLINREQNFFQNFGVSLRYYKASANEGAFAFKPESNPKNDGRFE